MGSMGKRKSLSYLLNGIAAWSNTVIAVLVAVGLLGLLGVPLLERRINFDENALLAGSASPTIRSAEAAVTCVVECCKEFVTQIS